MAKRKIKLPDAAYDELGEHLTNIALNKTKNGRRARHKNRVQVAAARVVMKIMELNAEPELQQHVHGHLFVNAEQSRLLEIAAEIGIEGIFDERPPGLPSESESDSASDG